MTIEFSTWAVPSTTSPNVLRDVPSVKFEEPRSPRFLSVTVAPSPMMSAAPGASSGRDARGLHDPRAAVADLDRPVDRAVRARRPLQRGDVRGPGRTR